MSKFGSDLPPTEKCSSRAWKQTQPKGFYIRVLLLYSIFKLLVVSLLLLERRNLKIAELQTLLLLFVKRRMKCFLVKSREKEKREGPLCSNASQAEIQRFYSWVIYFHTFCHKFKCFYWDFMWQSGALMLNGRKLVRFKIQQENHLRSCFQMV